MIWPFRGTARENVAQPENSVGSSRTSESKMLTRASQEEKSCKSEPQSDGKKSSADYHDDHLWLGASGSHNFYPESDHIYRGWIRASGCLSLLNRLVAKKAAGGLWNLYVGEEIIVFSLTFDTILRKFVGK
ncbi:unnamed protein product [Thlaspi arvense]|uniref:Uncharacterized protein n=1 Tax=Thlaspi arvense TaxID=13288 RepID=A0AAU9RF35_THLAR|nr:unnamed protein product [Thlaspi arvense]